MLVDVRLPHGAVYDGFALYDGILHFPPFRHYCRFLLSLLLVVVAQHRCRVCQLFDLLSLLPLLLLVARFHLLQPLVLFLASLHLQAYQQ